jgi:uncharacterized membrane-anchored protein
MKKHSRLLTLGNLFILLAFVNFSIWSKEKILGEGELVFLRLAPVDPRSLMQGDYMRLNYDIISNWDDSVPARGYCIVETDAIQVARKVRMQITLQPMKKGEKAIRYRKTNQRQINIGAGSFFFEEGSAEKYENAKYGGLRIDNKGNSILTGLYDSAFRKLN